VSSIGRRETTWLLVALLALGAVAAVRAWRFAADPHRLDAHGERRWLEFAYGAPYAAPAFEQARAALRPGEPVVLVVPTMALGLDYWRTIGLYHLPHHPLLEVYARPLPRRLPPAARVIVRRDGTSRVVRPVEDGGR
jgi:hypothetical protein